MLELTAIIVVLGLYIFPLNFNLYDFSGQTALNFVQKNTFAASLLTDFFYVFFTAVIFLAIYFSIRLIVSKSVYVYLDKDFDKILLMLRSGQRFLDAAAFVIILFMVILQFVLKRFDIKLIVFAVLCNAFIFRDTSIKDKKAPSSVTK